MTTETQKPPKPRRKFKKYILLALVILFLLWVFIPRPLSSEVKQQLTTMEKLHATPSKAFLYFIGMNAPDDVDPLVYGQKLLPQFVSIAQTDTTNTNTPPSIVEPNENKRNYANIFYNTPFNCSLASDLNCTNILFNKKVERKNLVAENSTFINRYQTYKSFGDYHQLYRLNILAMPAYQILIYGQKLYFLQQVELIDTHKISPKTMQDNILNDLAHWRSELITGDNLIYKLVVVALVRNDLLMLSEIHLRYGISTPMISELSKAERSFELVEAGETEFAVNIESNLKSGQDYCGTDDSEIKCFGIKVWYFLFYDSNDTVNMLAHYRTLALKQAPLPELYRNKDQGPPSISLAHWIRNSMGAFITKNGLEAYSPYKFRVNDLNLQIALLNATANQPVGNSDLVWLKNIPNPYGAAAGQAYIDKHGGLCFPVPIKDDSRSLNGCIPWKVKNRS